MTNKQIAQALESIKLITTLLSDIAYDKVYLFKALGNDEERVRRAADIIAAQTEINTVLAKFYAALEIEPLTQSQGVQDIVFTENDGE
jgi:hypothetical protein